jgi:hypothetical protein
MKTSMTYCDSARPKELIYRSTHQKIRIPLPRNPIPDLENPETGEYLLNSFCQKELLILKPTEPINSASLTLLHLGFKTARSKRDRYSFGVDQFIGASVEY